MKKTVIWIVIIFSIYFFLITCHLIVNPFNTSNISHRPSINDDNYKKRVTDGLLRCIAGGIRVYYKKTGYFPSTNAYLRNTFEAEGVVYTEDGRHFPYTMKDGWNNDICYSVSGTTAKLVSAGLDHVFFTKDDLTNMIVVQNGTNTVWDLTEEAIWSVSTKKR